MRLCAALLTRFVAAALALALVTPLVCRRSAPVAKCTKDSTLHICRFETISWSALAAASRQCGGMTQCDQERNQCRLVLKGDSHDSIYFFFAFSPLTATCQVYVHAVKAQYPDSDVVITGHRCVAIGVRRPGSACVGRTVCIV